MGWRQAGHPFASSGADGAAGQLWSLIFSDSLQGGSLAKFSQRFGAWTADVLGFHVNNGAAESYLSLEGPLLIGAVPFDEFSGWAMQCDIGYPAAGAATDDVGFVFAGYASGVGAGAVRTFLRRNGLSIGWDVFGSGGFQRTDGAPGATPVGNFRTFKVVCLAGRTSFYVDNVLYFQGQPNYPATVPSRVGLWSNTGHADFRNLKVWRVLEPTA